MSWCGRRGDQLLWGLFYKNTTISQVTCLRPHLLYYCFGDWFSVHEFRSWWHNHPVSSKWYRNVTTSHGFLKETPKTCQLLTLVRMDFSAPAENINKWPQVSEESWKLWVDLSSLLQGCIGVSTQTLSIFCLLPFTWHSSNLLAHCLR